MRTATALQCLAWVAIGAIALIVRAAGLHRGLIFPDGYDYLLMARGITTHLTPTVALGHGGELFVPSIDAALKPLFPAFVALLSPVAGLRSAADAVTVTGGAATVVLAGLLTTRLTGSRVAGIVAAAATLISPTLADWSGYAGPDPLAIALALACGLALHGRRVGLGGVLGALATCTRPEWLLVFTGLAIAALCAADTRAAAHRGLLFAAVTLGGVLAMLRPPIAAPTGGLWALTAAILGAAGVFLAAHWAAADSRRALAMSAAVIGVLAAACLAERASALGHLGLVEWPLVTLGVVGLLRACATAIRRDALTLLGAITVLAVTYAYRNSSASRYLAEIIPLLCVCAGFAAVPLPRRIAGRSVAVLAPAAGAAAIALLAVIAPSPSARATDTFAALAPRLAHSPAGPLVSAAPEAYGYLLPDRAQRSLAVGARGLILLDGAQRAYSPGLTARGTVIARLQTPAGFERPDGTLDMRPAVLVRGVVVRTG